MDTLALVTILFLVSKDGVVLHNGGDQVLCLSILPRLQFEQTSNFAEVEGSTNLASVMSCEMVSIC